MKKIVFLLLLSTYVLFSTEIKHINIGNQDFMLTVEEYDVYDSKGEVLRVYKEKRNNDLVFMFSLILKDRTGSCSDKSVEDGYYEVNDSGITLYSHWDRRGKAYDAPYGARIQVYTIDDNFNLAKTSSKLYIETERENYNETSGMKYLFKKPQNQEEKAELDAYVRSVERNFKGTFVFGDEAKKLMAEVEDAMGRKMKSIWQ
ncbi:hypothetical protein C9926_00425 [Sulfurovum lithotrophicum]|nr:hypothetical protein C9926_00425 [Sulfurovum lithotrophicum]